MHIERKIANLQNALTFYAFKEEATTEQLATFLKKDYSTALRIIKKLLDARWLKLERFERTEAKGKEKRYYALTVYGLEVFLNTSENSFKYIKEVAKVHSGMGGVKPSMLKTFEKWDKFVAAGCEETLIENMQEAVHHAIFARYLYMPLAIGKLLTPDQEAGTRRALDIQALGFLYMNKPLNHVKDILGKRWEGMVELWKVVQSDYELRLFRENFLHDLEVEQTETSKALGDWRKFLHENTK
jgi:DNA-binding PadR family transcriptional regulator